MGKMGKMLAWQLTKVKNKSEVIAEARTKGHAIHFTSLMNICHFKKFGVGTTFMDICHPEVQRSSRVPRRYCER